MILILDRILKKGLKSWLHSKKEAIVAKAIASFRKKRPEVNEAQITVLKNKLEFETTRIYPIVDQAILKAIIFRSRYIFWFMAFTTTLLMMLNNEWVFDDLLLTFTPLITAALTWVISVATIPVLYNLRVKGAMKSVQATYCAELDTALLPKPEVAAHSPKDSIVLIMENLASIEPEQSHNPPVSPPSETIILIKKESVIEEPTSTTYGTFKGENTEESSLLYP